ncbi:MAG: EAL domain-containing protein [Cellvibrionaceae bacterium]
MGLRSKLLLVWFILLLAPLAILSGIGYAYIDSQLKKDIINYQADVARSIADTADSYLSRLRYLTVNTSLHPELQIILNSEAPTAIQQAAGEKVLSSLISSDDAIREYYLIRGRDFSSPLLSVVDFQAGQVAPLSVDALQDIPANEISIFHVNNSDAINSRTANNPDRNTSRNANNKILTVVPIFNNGKVSGYLISAASVQLLTDIVAPLPGRETLLMLVEESGEIITGRNDLPFYQLPNPDQLYQQTAEGFLESYTLGDSDYILRIDSLDEKFWLLSLTDSDFLFEKKLPYIIIFMMALSLTLLFSGVIYNVYVNNIVIKPIQHLITATRQIAKGDFKPELGIRTKDELGELAVAFRQMGKQLMHSSRRIRQLAYFDPLTQLPNRTTLRETLNRLLQRAEQSKVKSAVLFIDLDDFKKVNDRLGHEAGDELLVQISDRLKNRLRLADVLFEQAGVTSVDQLISRRGGDEFNAILSSIKAPHDAAIVAERIIQDLNEPFFIAKSEIHVGASVGIAIFPNDGRDADTLLRNADLAMYEAKARGKNNYHIFTSAINEQVHQRLALENSLQVAMVQSQFRLYYQPKVSLTDMSPVGFEALIRWAHPEKGIILPGKFIPVAEESNLIRDLGNWILGESMQQIQLWEKILPEGFRIAINISAKQLSQVDLVDQLKTMMDHFDISPLRIEIELTETSVLQDEAMAIQHLHALREIGVEISLDDFGTGYSSLSFLRKLPIDTVKIDRSFTANVTQHGEARAIVVSLLALCRELNVKTIAEGIETTAQLQFLMEHGCDQGQGYLFSEPLPAEDVLEFLQEPSYLA